MTQLNDITTELLVLRDKIAEEAYAYGFTNGYIKCLEEYKGGTENVSNLECPDKSRIHNRK